MRMATVLLENKEEAAIVTAQGLVTVDTINRTTGSLWSTELHELLMNGEFEALRRWTAGEGKQKLDNMEAVPHSEAVYAPLYRHPRKIWGIGMNYVKAAAELPQGEPDSDPVGFMKPDTALIGPGDTIRLPRQSVKPTAEGELAIVIGKRCSGITEAQAPQFVAGLTASLDMTAADIHEQNPRYLTRAKSFDTFFSFGPQLVTLDEVPDVLGLGVETWQNGSMLHRNTVFHMKYRPWFTVAYLSQGMTLLPGDVIMTGTPGAAVLRDGDIVECRIDGFAPLLNPVQA
ncbi:fumarylacetoacetate hydrolase family protein [Paenibacillus sp. y28]|uniref:fumarylacetoacetate hydrolase family protein n=1 Tax=Paenibacillus sp. y28 TaxID=3129110 RepID=UPI0030168BE1